MWWEWVRIFVMIYSLTSHLVTGAFFHSYLNSHSQKKDKLKQKHLIAIFPPTNRKRILGKYDVAFCTRFKIGRHKTRLNLTKDSTGVWKNSFSSRRGRFVRISCEQDKSLGALLYLHYVNMKWNITVGIRYLAAACYFDLTARTKPFSTFSSCNMFKLFW